MRRSQPPQGSLIAKYRQRRGLSQSQLAHRIEVKPSYISLLESGKRPLANVGYRVARALARELHFEGEDFVTFQAATPQGRWGGGGLALLPQPPIHFETDDVDAVIEGVTSIVTLLSSGYRLLTCGAALPWVIGRSLGFKARVRTGIDYLRKAVSAVDSIPDISGDELLSLVYLDAADLLWCGGVCAEAGELTSAASNIVEPLCRERGESAPKRLAMAWARILLMRQTQWMLKADTSAKTIEDTCWRLHEEATPYLAAAKDRYGCAKTYYNLALIHLHRNDWDHAESLARLAVLHAQHIRLLPPNYDVLWMLRDGVLFGRSWWQANTRSLLFDISSLQGKSRELPPRSVASPAIPPHIPRYSWLHFLPNVRQAEEEILGWIEFAEREGVVIYLADMYISLGDFLELVRHQTERAVAAYKRAEEVSSRYGFTLPAETARRRRQGLTPLGGLAALVSQRIDQLGS